METIEILDLINNINNGEIETLNKVWNIMNSISNIRKEEIEKLPFYINVIASAARGNLKETAHSKILGDLIRNDKIQSSFIKNFTSIKDADEYEVTAETERIDVALRGNKHFVIIENKVNDAVEQESQIFRYVEIANQYHYSKENIHVVYLNSVLQDLPSDFSLKDSKSGKSVYEIMNKENLKVFSYKIDILNWLKELSSKFTSEEIYLKSAIIQYIDYLEEKFNCSKRYDNMNTKIKNELFKFLSFTDGLTSSEKYLKIQEALDEVNKLYSNIIECKDCVFCEDLPREIENKFSVNVSTKIWSKGNVEHDFKKEIKGEKYDFCIGIDKSRPWYGFLHNGEKDNHRLFKPLSEMGMFVDGNWICKWSTYETILNDFDNLLNVIEKGLD